jgi:glyoxylase-like metal-dependent hydrolase (beta-lactamase superfamily II)
VSTTLLTVLLLVVLGGGPPTASPVAPPPPPPSVRLYIIDGGTLQVADPARFQLTKDEVAATDLSVLCYLITHPKGTLLWDACAVPDSEWTPAGAPVKHHLVLADGQEREVILGRPLERQLAEAGYGAGDVTYLGLSHYHYDHTANANRFSAATWLVRQAERDAMFADQAPGVTRPSTYAALRSSNTLVIRSDEHDVFGDGRVIIKAAVGHTPGHQVLYVKLAQTGGLVLSGDLYHYPEERKLDRVPTFEFDAGQTRAARAEIEHFLRAKGARLWIQHDLRASARLRKAPAYYE